MTPDQYRANQQANAANSQAKVLTLFGLSALVGGLVSAAEFKQLAATVIAAANIQAAMLADLFMSRKLKTKPLGVGRPPDEPLRLADALAKIIADTDTPVPRIARLAAAEPLAVSQSTTRQICVSQGIKEYFWLPDDDPCSRCDEKADRVYSVYVPTMMHPGCSCLALPVLPKESE